MWIIIFAITIVVLMVGASRVICNLIRENDKMMGALMDIYKLEPDMFECPSTYSEDCKKAVKEMAKIAKRCVWEINSTKAQ